MTEYGTPNWSGATPQGDPPRPRSPFFETPIPRTVSKGKIPADASRNPYVANFAPWASWVFVSDDGGGGGLQIHPGIGGGEPVLATTGTVVWIGNGRCGVETTGDAPTSDIRLVGCNAEQAAVYASQGLSRTATNSANQPNGTQAENPVFDGSEQSLTVPAGTRYAVISTNASTTSPVTITFANGGHTEIGGTSVNTAVTVYGFDALVGLTFSGAPGESMDVIYYTRT